jgi:hypothetical protein
MVKPFAAASSKVSQELINAMLEPFAQLLAKVLQTG